MGRRFVGIDMDRDHVEGIAQLRIAAAAKAAEEDLFLAELKADVTRGRS